VKPLKLVNELHYLKDITCLSVEITEAYLK